MASWHAEFDLTPETVRRVVGAQFPALADADVAYLKEGWDSRAFEVAGRWIFRFPKRAPVEAQLAREWALLGAIAPRLPTSVPRYEFLGQPSALFPYRFGGYAKLEGRDARAIGPGTVSEGLVRALGAFLGALHAVPLALARGCGVDHHGWRAPELYRSRGLEAVERLRPVLGPARADACVAFIEAGCADARATAPGPEGHRLLHNDLSSDHVIVDASGEALVGIIDWSDVEIGDPAVDLAGVYHFLGEAGTRRVLAAYDGPWDEALLRRARVYAGCLGLFQMSYGHAALREEDRASGARALALALGDDHPSGGGA